VPRRAARGLALFSALFFGVLLAGFLAWRYEPLAPHTLAIPPAPGVTTAPAHLALAVFDPPRLLPAIRFEDAAGRGRSLRDFQGRVVLLNLWATWCAPCRTEMPALDRLEKELGGADFVVVPVSIDRDGIAAVGPFYRTLGIERLGVYIDPLGRGTSALAVPGLPTTLLIDAKGRLVARKMGGAQWDDRQIVALIGRYLPAAPAAARR
jgi:thiol-disulfide isomerase/thioredoxin